MRNSILRIFGLVFLVISILVFANINLAVESYFEKLEVAEILDRAMPALAKSDAIDRRASELEEQLNALVNEYNDQIARLKESNRAAETGPSPGGEARSVAIVWYGEVGWGKLKSYNLGCRPPGNLVSNQCFSAIHAFCQAEHGARAGISQEVGRGVATVACFN